MKVRFLLIKSSYLSPKRAQAVRRLRQRLRRRFCLDRKIKPHPAWGGQFWFDKKITGEKGETNPKPNEKNKTKQNPVARGRGLALGAGDARLHLPGRSAAMFCGGRRK